MEIIDWLNANDGAIIGIATIVLVGITGYYAYLTLQLLKVNDTPEIAISLRPHAISVNLVMLCIENVGTGAAHDVKFTTDPPSLPSLDIPFEKIGFLKSGIRYFEPGRKIEQFLVNVRGKFDELKQTQLKVTVTYKDSTNHKREQIFRLDFSEGMGFSQIGSPPLYDIAKTIKKIQKDFYDVATGFHKPIILTESLSKHHLGQCADSLESRIEQFPKEVQQEILQEVNVLVSKREQDEKTGADADFSQLSVEERMALLDQFTAKFMEFVGPNFQPLSDYAMSREGIYEDHP